MIHKRSWLKLIVISIQDNNAYIDTQVTVIAGYEQEGLTCTQVLQKGSEPEYFCFLPNS